MKKYSSYKESNIEWLGEIPAHWEIKKLGFSFSSIRNGSTVSQIDWHELTVPITRIETISTGQINKFKIGYAEYTKELLPYKLENGDILFSHINSLSMVGNVAQYFTIKNNELYHGMNLLRLIPSKVDYYRYLFWTLKSPVIRQSIESIAKPAINQASVSIDSLKSLMILHPPLEEQQQISDYLDQQTANIDDLVQKQKKLIELLQEKKKALINHVVTKGLNPNVPMQDSGIEWLGQIPAHWEVRKLKYLFKFNTGISVTKAEFIENGVKCINYGDIHSKYLFKLNLADAILPTIDHNFIYEKPSCILSENDLVFCDTSEDLDGVGNCVVISNLNGSQLLSGSHTIVSKPIITLNAIFIRYALMSKIIKSSIENEVTGIKVFSITQGILNNVTVTFPPLEEQQQIADYLDQQTAKIDQLINKAKSMVELLKEHKKSLINNVVTGKIKVING